MSVSAMPEPDAAAAASLVAPWARGVSAGIVGAGCRWVVYVPDNPLADVVRALAGEPGVRTVLATREEEAFGVAAGLYLGGAPAAVMLQSSGLGNSINALGSLLVAYRIPVLIVMSMRGGPGEWNEAQVPVGRAVPGMLAALGIQHTSADTVETAEAAVRLAGSLAFGTRSPAACLLPRALTASSARVPRERGFDTRLAALNGPSTAPDLPDAVEPSGAQTMSRLAATRVLVGRLRDEAVIASLGHPAYDLYAAGDRPANFYTWGSMGLASSIGLGLALARPDRRVIVCDGEGSLLMNLGSLATIAVMRPPNLTVVVWDNGEYATTGGQPSATAYGADLAGAARALGIAGAATVRTPAGLENALMRASAQAEPAVIVAEVTESEPVAKPPLDCVFLKQRFMAAIGTPDASTRGAPA
ncbi:MAG TPA: thiamine pyrophosphate-dependent enzyme [Vicinamibacterales bacterium]